MHADKSPTGKFCAVRSPSDGKCSCGNNHISNCSPTASWSPSEAHHLICVSSAASELVSDPTVQGIIRECQWCINAGPNMYAMPLGATTIRHYCSIVSAFTEFVQSSPPAFANIPHHNYDHNCAGGYLYESSKAVRGLKQSLKKAGHTLEGKDPAPVLNRLSGTFKTVLQNRGNRNGGTHASWLAATNQGTPGALTNPALWYLPFSMASTAVAQNRPIPTRDFGARTKRWISVAVKLLKG